MTDFKYTDWLTTHAKKKTIMEKLERSLVPFQLFSKVNLDSLTFGNEVHISENGNTYSLLLKDKVVAYERVVYQVGIEKENICNPWEDSLMGYTEYKIVTNSDKIVTIYPYRENFFKEVIKMFEAGRFDDLYKMRTTYLKNVLARYILLQLINNHLSYMSLLYICKTRGRCIPVLAGNENKEWVMYAFSKKEANDLAREYQGLCKKLTVVYFINRDFEQEDKNRNFKTENTDIVSIKEFYRNFDLISSERAVIEKQVFFLIEMLYDSRQEWNPLKLKKIINKAPRLTDRNPYWQDVPKVLVEDALNVLVEDYNNPKDIFHLLCAANLINTYTNRYKNSQKLALKNLKKKQKVNRKVRRQLNHRVHIMYRFKSQVMGTIVELVRRKSKFIKVSFGHVFGEAEYTMFTTVGIEGHTYQFKFRGMPPRCINELHALGVKDDGIYSMIRLQPVAPALYLYSYHLKWK